MKESAGHNQEAPLSYYGARRIVWLIFLLVIAWFVLRSLQSVVLLFAIVFLTAMVLNPIIVWLRKHHVPRILFATAQTRLRRDRSQSSGSSRAKKSTLTLC
jgi:small-conductance mechanosensitive channel